MTTTKYTVEEIQSGIIGLELGCQYPLTKCICENIVLVKLSDVEQLQKDINEIFMDCDTRIRTQAKINVLINNFKGK